MEYLKDMPIAVLGGGAVGKTCAADMKLAGKEVRLWDAIPFAEKSLKTLDKTGILLDGIQRNKYCFERSGRAFFDLVTTDIGEAVKGAGQIVIAMGSWGHEPTFRALIPHLEDGQVIHIFSDNFGCLLLRRLMRETGCTKKVIIGGWSSAPYGTRIETIGDFPKYGNDDDRVDMIAKDMAHTVITELRKTPTYRNAIHTLSVLTITSNVMLSGFSP